MLLLQLLNFSWCFFIYLDICHCLHDDSALTCFISWLNSIYFILICSYNSCCWEIRADNISFKFTALGFPSINATILILNDVLIWVCWNRLFKRTPEISDFFNSITTLIPSLSDSSLNSEIPSIFLSRTSSAIFSINLARGFSIFYAV